MAKFHIFEDAEGRWRWHFLADNNRIMADSGQGYESMKVAVDASMRFKQLVNTADVGIDESKAEKPEEASDGGTDSKPPSDQSTSEKA